MTNEERYALGLMVEEMGETLQLVGKALRFGLDTPGRIGADGQVDMSLTPRTLLPIETGDVLAAIDFAFAHRVMDEDSTEKAHCRKINKLLDPAALDNLGKQLAPQPKRVAR